MYQQWGNGNTAEVAVISLLMSALLLAIVAVLRRSLRLRDV
jgi:ABC-type Fe3+ transport system permease subunit